MCLLEWFSDLGPNDSFVLTTRCGSQGTPTHSSLSSPRFLWLTLLFWTALNFLWFPLPPPESFSFFNHRSIHAWIEIVKSALNTRSKISAKSYQFHGSKNNSINLYFLKDTRIPWPICISLSILDKPLSNCGTYANKLNLLSFESLTGKLKKIIPQRVFANIKATSFEII